MLSFCPSWSCTIICCINWVTSLRKNLFNLLEFLAETFRCRVHHFQCLTVRVKLAAMFRFLVRTTAASSTGTVKHWKWCKTSAKNSSKLNKFLHSEVNQLIQHNHLCNINKLNIGREFFSSIKKKVVFFWAFMELLVKVRKFKTFSG